MKPHPEGQQAAYLTVREVAELLAVSIKTVYQLVKAGKLGAVRVGRVVRIPRAGLDDYLAGRRTRPPRQPSPKATRVESRRRSGVVYFPRPHP